ncbi:hypothetical protein OK074_5810 [Actinobacteria bacterium OK074]|nr:hypothetical protein OK074_5810 [Actinobacteria bacterium OK074]
MTLFVTVILGLILVILGLSAGWPLWAWPTTAAILLVVATVTHRILAPELPPIPRELLPHPDLPLPEPQRQEQRVGHVALPSSVADYDFSFSATVRWLLLDAPHDAPYVNPAGLAVDAVIQRARAVTAGQPPHRSAFAQHQLDGALATMRADATGRVMAMAQDVVLNLPEPDRERLVKLSNVRKDEDVWEHERNYERSKRTYLGEDVLKDTGSAVVWWLSRNEEEVEAAVDRIALFARLSAAANNTDIAPEFEHLVYASDAPEPGRQQPYDTDDAVSWNGASTAHGANGAEPGLSAADVLAWFDIAPDDPDADLITERLINVVQVHGRTAVADRLAHHAGRSQTQDDATDATDATDSADGVGDDGESDGTDETPDAAS